MSHEEHRDPGSPRREENIPPPKDDPGTHATDDHVANPASRGGHQPTDGLDPTIDDEHLRSPSQGVRPSER